jgi:hypothetical protein
VGTVKYHYADSISINLFLKNWKPAFTMFGPAKTILFWLQSSGMIKGNLTKHYDHFYYTFGIYTVQILAGLLLILTEVFHGFPQSLKASTRIWLNYHNHLLSHSLRCLSLLNGTVGTFKATEPTVLVLPHSTISQGKPKVNLISR